MAEALETTVQKAGRHLREISNNPGLLFGDPGMLVRGIKFGLEDLFMAGAPESWFGEPVIIEDYKGIDGLTVACYRFTTPVASYVERMRKIACISLSIIEPPLGSKLHFYLTESDRMLTPEQFIKILPWDGVAITGPTVTPSTQYLPNNGFYFQQAEQTVLFNETNPPGDRRGAFGINDQGDLKLLTDQEKWIVLKSGFKGFQFIAGTSTYFASGDAEEIDAGMKCDGWGNLSYLFQYQDSCNNSRIGFGVSHGRLSRHSFRAVLRDYFNRNQANTYFGVELEQTGSVAVIKTDGLLEKFGGSSFPRRDHYFFSLT